MTREEIIDGMGWSRIADLSLSDMLERIERLVAVAEAATTQKLYAEIMELRQELARQQSMAAQWQRDAWRYREIEALREKLERQQSMATQWQRDAWRYRFLLRHDGDYMCRDPLWPVVDWMQGTAIVAKREIDAAIDAAMAEERKP